MSAPRLYAHLGDTLPAASRQYSLNPEEKAREANQSNPDTRRAYRLSRLLWRTGARAYCVATTMPPVDERALPASGNPEVPGQCFHSSLSHCTGFQVAAFHGHAVGIDAEPVTRSVPWQRLAERWFSETERQWLEAGTDAEQRFLMLWTLKEAWIKATDRGIAGNLQALELVPGPAGDRLRIDRPESDWCAATTVKTGFRVSVLWRGAGSPLWHGIAEPGSEGSRPEACEWRQFPLET